MNSGLYAIVLSNNNRNFIYTIKNILSYRYGINVSIALNYIDVFNYVSSNACHILVVDCDSVSFSMDICKIFSCNDSNFFIPNIVAVGGSEEIDNCVNICMSDFECMIDGMIGDMYTRSHNTKPKISNCSLMSIGDYLIELGLSTDLLGYYYIRDGVYYIVSKGVNHACLSKYIYSYLSNKYSKTVYSIEKNIRYAIKVTDFKDKNLNNINIKRALTLIANKFMSKNDKLG